MQKLPYSSYHVSQKQRSIVSRQRLQGGSDLAMNSVVLLIIDTYKMWEPHILPSEEKSAV